MSPCSTKRNFQTTLKLFFFFLHIKLLPIHFSLCLVLNEFLFAGVTMLQSCETVFCWLQSPLEIGLLRPFLLYKSRSILLASWQINSFKWHSNKPPGPNYSSISRRGDFERSRMQAVDPIVCRATILSFLFVQLYLFMCICSYLIVEVDHLFKNWKKGLQYESYFMGEVDLH